MELIQIREGLKQSALCFQKRKKDHVNLANITLDGVSLPWVNKVNHLGCVLESDNSLRADVSQKRAAFIGKVNSIMQELHFVSPSVIL